MSGLAGVIVKNNNGRIEHQFTVEKMLNSIKHRGSDCKDFNLDLDDNHISLGWCGSDEESQRKPAADPEVICLIDGELNYLFEEKGIREEFQNNFPLLLNALYKKDGIKFIEELDGFYTIAIFDTYQKKLILIRDPIGIKPLYYYLDPEVFLFGSEMKAILANDFLRKEIDPQSVLEFFTFRCVPGSYSPLKDVRRVAPSNILIFDLNEWKLSEKKYWTPEILQPISSLSEATGLLKKLLFESARKNLSNQAQTVGIAASGGIDSSTIAGVVRSLSQNRPVHTFSVHVKDDPEDLSCIEEISHKINSVHHWAECKTTDISMLPSIIYRIGEPISAGMIIPSFQCYAQAKQNGINIIFNGDGSDEFFAGYSGRLFYDGILRNWGDSDQILKEKFLEENPRLNEKLATPLGQNKLTPLERYALWDDDNTFSSALRDRLLINSGDPLKRLRIFEDEIPDISYENKMLFLEIKIRLEGFMLPITERTSMASGVECRAPFLDPRIVNFAFNLSPKLKNFKGIEKYILRKTIEKTNLLPNKILWRRKHPFSGPISTWIDHLPPNLESLLLSKEVIDSQGYLRSETVATMYKLYKEGKLTPAERIQYSDLLFAVLVFTIWVELFLNSRNVEEIENFRGSFS